MNKNSQGAASVSHQVITPPYTWLYCVHVYIQAIKYVVLHLTITVR